MLIKLIPPPPHPTVLFTLAFPAPPAALPLPQAYTQLLHTLQASTPALDIPASLQALDRATWMVECLAEVIFDLGSESVRCIWVDGSMDEWPLSAGAGIDGDQFEDCLRMLRSVLEDVDLSAEESERERLREEWDERYQAMAQAHAQAQAQAAVAIPAAPHKPTKHKKQRSLLMTFVASLVPSLSPPSLCHSLPVLSESRPQPAAVFQPPPPPPPPSDPNLSSRHLRRRARSTLVDAWRRYILGELRARVGASYPTSNSTVAPPCWESRTYNYGGLHSGGAGGYHPWIVRSMLRRAEAHMAWIVHENGGVVPELSILDSMESDTRRRARGMTITRRVPSNSPFFDSEEDEDGLEQEGADANSLSTDTDGSSVHTPSESPFPSYPFQPGSDAQGKQISPAQSPASLTLLRTYRALTTHALHLQHLLTRLSSFSTRARIEEDRGMVIVELKSRRRAWSNAMFLGGIGKGGGFSGTGSGGGGIGCAAVGQSSPLRWGCVRAEDLMDSEYEESDSGDATITDISASPSRLFPVSEEDEFQLDDTHHSPIADESFSYADLEAGLLSLDMSDLSLVSQPPPFPSRNHNHTRTRTQSMYQSRPPPILIPESLPSSHRVQRTVPRGPISRNPQSPEVFQQTEKGFTRMTSDDLIEFSKGMEDLGDEERRMRERELFEFDYESDYAGTEDGSAQSSPWSPPLVTPIELEMAIEEWEENVDAEMGDLARAEARTKGVEGAVLKSGRGEGLAFTLEGEEAGVVGEWLPGVMVNCR